MSGSDLEAATLHQLLTQDELRLLLSPQQLSELGYERDGVKLKQPFEGATPSLYGTVLQLQQQVAELTVRVQSLERRLALAQGMPSNVEHRDESERATAESESAAGLTTPRLAKKEPEQTAPPKPLSRVATYGSRKRK